MLTAITACWSSQCLANLLRLVHALLEKHAVGVIDKLLQQEPKTLCYVGAEYIASYVNIAVGP